MVKLGLIQLQAPRDTAEIRSPDVAGGVCVCLAISSKWCSPHLIFAASRRCFIAHIPQNRLWSLAYTQNGRLVRGHQPVVSYVIDTRLLVYRFLYLSIHKQS